MPENVLLLLLLLLLVVIVMVLLLSIKKCNMVKHLSDGWCSLFRCHWFGFCGSLVAYIRFLMLQNTFSYHITSTAIFSKLLLISILVIRLLHLSLSLSLSFFPSLCLCFNFLIVVYICCVHKTCANKIRNFNRFARPIHSYFAISKWFVCCFNWSQRFSFPFCCHSNRKLHFTRSLDQSK